MNVQAGDRFRIFRGSDHGRLVFEGLATVVREIPSLFDAAPDMAVAFVRFDRDPHGHEIVERVVHEANRAFATGDLFAATGQ